MAVPTLAPARAQTLSPATAPGAPARDRRLGVVAIVASATAMGAAGVFGRLASPSDALLGEALTLGRMLFGAVGMLAVLALGRRLHLVRRTRLSASVVVGGVALGLSLATLLSAAVLVDLALAVALHYLGPVLAVVLARVLLREKAGPTDLAALGTSFVGMMLVAGLVGEAPVVASEQRTLGIALGIASGILYGVALVSYRYRGDMPSDVRSLWNFVFGAVGTGALVAVTRPDLSGMTATHWTWAAVFFLVCGLVALGLLVVAGKHLRATELSGLSYGEVVVAALLGAVLFGEAWTTLTLLGAVLVVVGAVLPLLPGRRTSASAETAHPSRSPASWTSSATSVRLTAPSLASAEDR